MAVPGAATDEPWACRQAYRVWRGAVITHGGSLSNKLAAAVGFVQWIHRITACKCPQDILLLLWVGWTVSNGVSRVTKVAK